MLFAACLIFLANLAIDLLYGWIDAHPPRRINALPSTLNITGQKVMLLGKMCSAAGDPTLTVATRMVEIQFELISGVT